MGYSYWESFERNSQSNVINSLHIALQKTNCASNDLETVINNGGFRFVHFQDNVLRLVNERNEILSISFPAVLDLDGNYSCIPPNSVSNSSFEQYASAIFELSPLKNSHEYEISTELMHSCSSAISIMQTLYRKTELIIRNHYHSWLDGFPTPFIIFDDEKDDFVFIIKTKPSFNFLQSEDEGPSVNRLPDIRHTDGRVLLPNEYRSKLQNNSIVMVDVHFELEIGPCHRRDYQVILNSLHSFPEDDMNLSLQS